MNPSSDTPRLRESATLRILGCFFIILGALVLLGTCWTLENFRASVVNVGSGIVLAAVGVGMVLIARRLASSESDTTGAPGGDP